MSNYKVGDVAALFPEPKLSRSEVGKKLQSLFGEFHGKTNKHSVQSPQKFAYGNQQKKKTENEENGDQRNAMKDKKRKFSSLNLIAESYETPDNKDVKKFNRNKPEYTNNFQKIQNHKSSLNLIAESYKTPDNENVKKFKKSEPEDNKLLQNNEDKGKNSFPVERDFPRRKKKGGKFNPANSFEGSNRTKSSPQQYNFVLDNAPNMNDSKKSKQVSVFLKKSMNQKYNANNSINNSAGTEKFEVWSSEGYGVNSTSFNSENNEQVKSKSKKQKDHNDYFMLNNQSEMKKPDFLKVPNRNVSAFDDSDTLFKSENKEFGKNKSKRPKKKNNNFMHNSQLNTSDLKEPDFIKVPDVVPGSKRVKKSLEEEWAEKLTRTLFVGNLPTNAKRKDLKKLFSAFGAVDNVRYHPIETDKSNMYRKGGPKEQKLNYAAKSLPGFVVFKERQSAVDALSLSGSVFKDHHITVDFAMGAGSKKLYDDKRSIFMGNLPFDIKDENIWEAFAECGNVEGVRVVRDRETGIGKGFGYVLFKCVQSKEKALALDNLEIQERKIRIKPVDSNKKTQNKSDNTPSTKDSFKSKAIKFKKSQENHGSRKSVKKIMKREKNLHKKKKIASILQKSMK